MRRIGYYDFSPGFQEASKWREGLIKGSRRSLLMRLGWLQIFSEWGNASDLEGDFNFNIFLIYSRRDLATGYATHGSKWISLDTEMA